MAPETTSSPTPTPFGRDMAVARVSLTARRARAQLPTSDADFDFVQLLRTWVARDLERPHELVPASLVPDPSVRKRIQAALPAHDPPTAPSRLSIEEMRALVDVLDRFLATRDLDPMVATELLRLLDALGVQSNPEPSAAARAQG